MTNEAVKVELTNNTGFPRRFTVASGTSISKGTLCNLSDPRTAAAATTVGEVCSGIASADKDGTDYSTSLAMWTDGIFEMVASGAITVGNPVISASDANYPNTVSEAAASSSGATVIGYALETGSDAETINVRIQL